MKYLFFITIVIITFPVMAEDSPPIDRCTEQSVSYAEAMKKYQLLIAAAEAQQRQVTENYKKQVTEYNHQVTTVDEQLEVQKKILVLAEENMKLQKDLLSAQAKSQERLDKIIATWEQQQKQYQSYLNGLPNK